MRSRFKTLLTLDRVTTLADIAGTVLIAVGVGLLAGLGAALICAGVGIIAISYMVAR